MDRRNFIKLAGGSIALGCAGLGWTKEKERELYFKGHKVDSIDFSVRVEYYDTVNKEYVPVFLDNYDIVSTTSVGELTDIARKKLFKPNGLTFLTFPLFCSIEIKTGKKTYTFTGDVFNHPVKIFNLSVEDNQILTEEVGGKVSNQINPCLKVVLPQTYLKNTGFKLRSIGFEMPLLKNKGLEEIAHSTIVEPSKG